MSARSAVIVAASGMALRGYATCRIDPSFASVKVMLLPTDFTKNSHATIAVSTNSA